MLTLWIRVNTNVGDDPLILEAAEHLGVSVAETVGLFVLLSGKAVDHRTKGYLGDLSDANIERWAGWDRPRKRGRFAEFVKERYLDCDGRIPNWDELHGTLEAHRERDAERKAKERAQSRESKRSSDSPTHPASVRESPGTPEDVRVTSRATVQNRTEQDVTEQEEAVAGESHDTSAAAENAKGLKRQENTEGQSIPRTPLFNLSQILQLIANPGHQHAVEQMIKNGKASQREALLFTLQSLAQGTCSNASSPIPWSVVAEGVFELVAIGGTPSSHSIEKFVRKRFELASAPSAAMALPGAPNVVVRAWKSQLCPTCEARSGMKGKRVGVAHEPTCRSFDPAVTPDPESP